MLQGQTDCIPSADYLYVSIYATVMIKEFFYQAGSLIIMMAGHDDHHVNDFVLSLCHGVSVFTLHICLCVLFTLHICICVYVTYLSLCAVHVTYLSLCSRYISVSLFCSRFISISVFMLQMICICVHFAYLSLCSRCISVSMAPHPIDTTV